KGIAGGLPLAGVTGRAEIMDAALPGGLGGTFGGNPVAVAAALAVFEQIERDGLLAEADRIGATLAGLLAELARRHPVVGEVRGHGAMMAFELVEPGTKTPLAGAAQRVAAHAAQQGVLLLTAGSYDNVIRFLPTLRTDDRMLRYAVSVIDEALAGL
ncbi:aminotransferase class III-fold pyridoxal phosphate-dependent enzyme, partial [Agromyces mediolanus]|uniref:aminotransferase class III-fold pyridoxal phosphate-dependent enzyme n=1 Tax=Agromyces mediolanus TaxID=41986 RepID=UPI001E59076A